MKQSDVVKNEYNLLDTKDRIDHFLHDVVSHFHDAVMTECHYESGSTRDKESNSLHCIDTKAKLIIIIESQCQGGFTCELIFHHVKRFNLVPVPQEYDSLLGDVIFI